MGNEKSAEKKLREELKKSFGEVGNVVADEFLGKSGEEQNGVIASLMPKLFGMPPIVCVAFSMAIEKVSKEMPMEGDVIMRVLCCMTRTYIEGGKEK